MKWVRLGMSTAYPALVLSNEDIIQSVYSSAVSSNGLLLNNTFNLIKIV
jgi:hypothetical protein